MRSIFRGVRKRFGLAVALPLLALGSCAKVSGGAPGTSGGAGVGAPGGMPGGSGGVGGAGGVDAAAGTSGPGGAGGAGGMGGSARLSDFPSTPVLDPSAPVATTTFTVAPVDAPGKIVYWALANDLGMKVGSLKGFGIGEESVQDVLVPSQVPGRSTTETCVGCHAATPDGNSVGFSMGPNGYTGDLADVRSGLAGTMPTYVAPAAQTAMRSLRGIAAFSPAHWTDGDRLMLLSDTGPLHWIELSGGATGTLARTGDSRPATEPTFAHDGQHVVYVSGASLIDGHLDDGPADLYAIPFANRAGGAATPLPGASEAGATEYYPAFSPDDALVAFTRIAGSGSSYSNPAAEVYVVPFNGGQGGTSIRLAANDAAACQAGVQSPGLTNDWPKWSPRATTASDGRTYYWLTFSSKRTGSPNAQLYITGVIREPSGQLTTTPALYLWNQPAADGNHTPSWDDFAIPPIVIGFAQPVGAPAR
jgi:hypothetical protein